ncbi:MAG: SprB repeat-containing protein [Chitinophagales bacterium]
MQHCINKTLTEPSTQLTSTLISGNNLTCFSNATGSVDLSPTGGTTPYTFYWNTGATTEDITGVAAGNYTVIITDAHGCTATNAITITQPARVTVSGVVKQCACNGATTGSIG